MRLFSSRRRGVTEQLPQSSIKAAGGGPLVAAQDQLVEQVLGVEVVDDQQRGRGSAR